VTAAIVAIDNATAGDPAGVGQVGVAVLSAAFAVGRFATWAEPGTGAAVTAGIAEVAHGPEVLAALAAGRTATEALADAVRRDPGAALRQLAAVGVCGDAAAHTGAAALAHRGHHVGSGYAVAASLMAGAGAVAAMATAFEDAAGDLAHRLLAALDAAQRCGGDLRGPRAAALRVVTAAPPPRPGHGVVVDLRVDDHPDAPTELGRLLAAHGDHARLHHGLARLLSGDVAGALAVAEELRAALGATPDRAGLEVAARLAGGATVDEAAAALARSPCDPAVVCDYLARSVEAGHLRLDERAGAALAALHARRRAS
jgi:uncharacterized Ntn-hydrolase superfamily protein